MTDRVDWPWLPDLLLRCAEKFGLGVALQLASEFGGKRITLPRRSSRKHAIAKMLGDQVLEWLMTLERTHIDVPLGPVGQQRERARKIAQLDDQHKSARQIAGALRITERTVHNHRARRRDRRGVDGRQGSLI